MNKTIVLSAIYFFTFSAAMAGAQRCIDVSDGVTNYYEGVVNFKIMPGPPNFENVQKGDHPEPTYFLKLDENLCAESTTDDDVDPSTLISVIQIIPGIEYRSRQAFEQLRSAVGRHVVLTSHQAMGGHTAHHHAPLLVAIDAIQIGSDQTFAYGTAETTVRAFYAGLTAGDGEEAARYIVPEKTLKGPFSAAQMTKYYGSLAIPLQLKEIHKVEYNLYNVKYTFVDQKNKKCIGEALITTVVRDGKDYIQSIRALNGC